MERILKCKKQELEDTEVMMEIKVAYLLVAHKNVEQVNLYIKQLLESGNCDVYVHVDKKNKQLFENIIQSPRVFVISVFDVRWGSFEIVKAAIELMKMAKESEEKYTHFYFGSGQDLMVKKGFYEYLLEKPKSVFLHVVKEITDTDRESARYRVCWPKRFMIRNDLHPYRFIRIAIQLLCKIGIVINKNKKMLKKELRFYEGRTWFIAPWNVLEYILDYIDSNGDYIEFWENSLASDLMFFQTIIMNSSFIRDVEDELMLVRFGETFKTINHPLNITIEDDSVIECGNFFFARKFEYYDDPQSFKYYLNKTRVE